MTSPTRINNFARVMGSVTAWPIVDDPHMRRGRNFNSRGRARTDFFDSPQISPPFHWRRGVSRLIARGKEIKSLQGYVRCIRSIGCVGWQSPHDLRSKSSLSPPSSPFSRCDPVPAYLLSSATQPLSHSRSASKSHSSFRDNLGFPVTLSHSQSQTQPARHWPPTKRQSLAGPQRSLILSQILSRPG